MKTKRWAMLAGGIMLVGLLLLVIRAAAEDVGETCVNVSDNVAVAACTRAIRSGGHNAHRLAALYGNRCAAYINNGKSDEALSDCNQAIQLDPKNAVAYANRCAAHINKGETDDALRVTAIKQSNSIQKMRRPSTIARPGIPPKVTMTAPSPT